MAKSTQILIVGAGIFGVTAALELAERGAGVMVIDPGPLPHPLAASTDISKVVRMEYGTDEDYMALVEASLPGWREWNDLADKTLYHETGVTMFTQEPMQPGGFEYDSYEMLLKRGHQPERLNADDIAKQFPGWHAGHYVDGFYHKLGGFAESGRVVETLIAEGKRKGVTFLSGQKAVEILVDGGVVTGVRTEDGTEYSAEIVVIAAGAWTPVLLPELAPLMRITGHPVFHLQTDQPELFSPPLFATFTADVARTGWYGFPLHPTERVIKVANHGVGKVLHPEHDERVVYEADEANLRHFLRSTFPALADAPIVYTRRCLYCDTLDEHLLIDQHPELEGLYIASGGSGHGFKFAPMLGKIVADRVEAKENQWLPKFKWRTLPPSTSGKEAARHHG
ncbi:MAG: FAD-dependent oxidoreductase [Anaerolineaceae bacterium]|nr:FAD-dependent oxidoreductase [Anaerolineaceae bacterium]